MWYLKQWDCMRSLWAKAQSWKTRDSKTALGSCHISPSGRQQSEQEATKECKRGRRTARRLRCHRVQGKSASRSGVLNYGECCRKSSKLTAELLGWISTLEAIGYLGQNGLRGGVVVDTTPG